MITSYESILCNWQTLFKGGQIASGYAAAVFEVPLQKSLAKNMTSKSGFTQSADFLPYVKDTVCKRKMGTNIEPGRSSYRSNLPPVYEVTITNNYASEERPFYDDLLIVT